MTTFSTGAAVRLQGYGRRPRRPSSPWLRLGVMALIVIAVAVTALFRHLSHLAGDGLQLAAAPSKVRPDVSRPTPASAVSTAGVSANVLMRAEPAAPVAPPAPSIGTTMSGGGPSTTAPAVAKPMNEAPVAGPPVKAAAASGGNGSPPSIPGGGGRRYHVQVGAFADKAAAEELAGRLRVLGYAVKIVGAQPFLVWVGGYLDEPTAGRLLAHLRGQGFDAVLNSGGTHPL